MEPLARFIGVTKTEMRKFPMTYLSNIELQNRGDMSGFLTRPVDRKNMVLVYLFGMDQNRRYLVFTGVSTKKVRPYTRMRLEARGTCPKYRYQYG